MYVYYVCMYIHLYQRSTSQHFPRCIYSIALTQCMYTLRYTPFSQVRHPLPVIGALTTHLFSSKLYAARVCNLTTQAMYMSEIVFAAQVWLCWNMHISSYATWRFRVEDDYIEELCERAELSCKLSAFHNLYNKSAGKENHTSSDSKALKERISKSLRASESMDNTRRSNIRSANNTNTIVELSRKYWRNHRDHIDVTWGMLEEEDMSVASKVRALAKVYGYV